jgi:hypothetical protein
MVDPSNAGNDIGIDQNTIAPQADNSKNKACANPPSQNKGKGPPSCVGHLVVIKHVINDNGGTSTGDFTIDVSRPFSGAESPGTEITLTPGPFRVSETGPAGYTQILSGGCFGTINVGGKKVCTITNNDNLQSLQR